MSFIRDSLPILSSSPDDARAQDLFHDVMGEVCIELADMLPRLTPGQKQEYSKTLMTLVFKEANTGPLVDTMKQMLLTSGKERFPIVREQTKLALFRTFAPIAVEFYDAAIQDIAKEGAAQCKK